LLSAASNYDSQYAPKAKSACTTVKPPRRSIYAHDLAGYGDDDPSDLYNLDSDAVDLQAIVHKQHSKAPAFAGNGTSPRLCLTSQQWHSLQLDARATWDLLYDEVNAIILDLRQSQNSKDEAQYLLHGLSVVATVVWVPWHFLDMLVLTVFLKFG